MNWVSWFDAFRPVLESTFKRCIERIIKSKKPKTDHQLIVQQAIEPVLRGLFMLQNDRDPILQAQITTRAFIEAWIKEELRESDVEVEACVARVLDLTGRVAEIHVIAAPKPEEKSANYVFNLEAPPPPPPPQEANEMIVSWDHDNQGKRRGRIQIVKAANEAGK